MSSNWYLDTAAVDIAHHCTQIDHDLFLSIRSIEWVKFSEGPHALDGKSLPHLSAFQRQSIQVCSRSKKYFDSLNNFLVELLDWRDCKRGPFGPPGAIAQPFYKYSPGMYLIKRVVFM